MEEILPGFAVAMDLDRLWGWLLVLYPAWLHHFLFSLSFLS